MMNTRALALRMKFFRFVVIAAFTGFIFQPYAYADMVTTEQIVSQAQTASMKVKVMDLLSREDVQAQMVDMGVELSLNQAYASLDALPAGGGVAGTVLPVLLIILILDIAGVTDIFPGV